MRDTGGTPGTTGETARGPTAVQDVDAAILAGESPPSARTPLDRQRIVAGGLGYIDEHGVDALTMRRLGAALGVEAMALYRHVPGKADLLDAIVESLVAEMRADPDVLDSPENGWQDFLQRLAHGVRRIALAHPKAFPLIASRPPEAPWLRPPLRSLDWVETFLQGMLDEGFADDAAVAAYRAFSSFLLGHLLLEMSAHGAEVGPLDAHTERAEAGLDEFPVLTRLSGALAEDHAAAEFEESLEDLLERLQRVLDEDPRHA